MLHCFRLSEQTSFSLRVQDDPESKSRVRAEVGVRIKPENKLSELSARLTSQGRLELAFQFRPLPHISIIQSSALKLREFSADAASFGIGFLVDL